MCPSPLGRPLGPVSRDRQSVNRKLPARREQMTPHASSLLNLRRNRLPCRRQRRRAPLSGCHAALPRGSFEPRGHPGRCPRFTGLDRGRPRCRRPALWSADLADPLARRSRRHPGCSRPRHRHRPARHALLLLRHHDRPCSGTAQRRALAWPRLRCAWPSRKPLPPTAS